MRAGSQTNISITTLHTLPGGGGRGKVMRRFVVRCVYAVCTRAGAMYCTLLPMQTDTDCTDSSCALLNYTVHGSPVQVCQLLTVD